MVLDKLEKLNALFADMERALIAYSGGIDSTLVAKVAHNVLGDRALAVTAVSPSLLPEDLEEAGIQAVRHWHCSRVSANPRNEQSQLHGKPRQSLLFLQK